MPNVMDGGSEKCVAFASRALKNPKRNYSQIEKEGLNVTFGVKQFYQYALGKSFKIITDHKHFLGFFNEHKGIHSMSFFRIKRWTIILSSYSC